MISIVWIICIELKRLLKMSIISDLRVRDTILALPEKTGVQKR